MRFPWVCLCLCTVVLTACDDLQPQPTVATLVPDQGYSDGDIQLTLLGDSFVPATLLDPSSGRRSESADGFQVRVGSGTMWTQLANLTWQSPSRISGLLSSASARDLTPGWLAVELTDPRGGVAVRPDVFHELGHDDSAPTVTILGPAIPVTAGTGLSGTIHAADVPPGTLATLGWVYSGNGVANACRIFPGVAEADCRFDVPTGADLAAGTDVSVTATAVDAAGNTAKNTLTITLHAKLSVASISPTTGGTAGGTDVVIKGSGFVAGTWATLDGIRLFPAGGSIVDESTLSGYVPAHAGGTASLMVYTPSNQASLTTGGFTYVPPPLIEAVTPAAGAPGGGTPIAITGQYFSQQTQIYFGLTLDSAVSLRNLALKSDTSIIGLAPLGTGQTTVWAFDATLGWSQLKNGFSWSAP